MRWPNTNIMQIEVERIALREYMGDAINLWLKGEPIPYIWGGQNWKVGVDCSGFVILGLIEAKILPDDFDDTAQGLFNRFESTAYPKLGDLVFYGRDLKHITHVMMYYHGNIAVEAGGGGKSTTTIEKAKKADACVAPTDIDRRRDFRGFGRVL